VWYDEDKYKFDSVDFHTMWTRQRTHTAWMCVGGNVLGVTSVGVGCVVLQYLAILGRREKVVFPLGDVLLEVV